jgi:hypothetical protein
MTINCCNNYSASLLLYARAAGYSRREREFMGQQ